MFWFSLLPYKGELLLPLLFGSVKKKDNMKWKAWEHSGKHFNKMTPHDGEFFS